jgi:hypothetical protein
MRKNLEPMTKKLGTDLLGLTKAVRAGTVCSRL